MLSLKFGTIYGAHICEAAGVDVAHLANLLADGDPAKVSAKTIESGDFTLGPGSASVNVALGVVSNIQSQARRSGIETTLPDLLVALFSKAAKDGFGNEDSSAVIKALRAAQTS